MLVEHVCLCAVGKKKVKNEATAKKRLVINMFRCFIVRETFYAFFLGETKFAKRHKKQCRLKSCNKSEVSADNQDNKVVLSW